MRDCGIEPYLGMIYWTLSESLWRRDSKQSSIFNSFFASSLLRVSPYPLFRLFRRNSRSKRSSNSGPMRFSSLLALALVSPCFAFGEEEPASPEDPPGPLSHAALFAPNTTFPYFERINRLHATDEPVFDPRNAAMLAQCSMLIYVEDRQFIMDTLAKAFLGQTEFFDYGGTYAFIAEGREDIVIAFRGTETGDKIDYLTDAKFLQTDFAGLGRAHSGFVAAYELVKEPIAAELAKRLAKGDKRVWATGHSLGGALATLWSLDNPSLAHGIYTIGSPRVVDGKLARVAGEQPNFFRLVNNNDIIPRLPGPPFYQHIGSTYYITAQQELIVDPPRGKLWKSRWKGHRKFLAKLLEEHWSQRDFRAIPSDYFVDHSPRLYVEALFEISVSDPTER